MGHSSLNLTWKQMEKVGLKKCQIDGGSGWGQKGVEDPTVEGTARQHHPRYRYIQMEIPRYRSKLTWQQGLKEEHGLKRG